MKYVLYIFVITTLQLFCLIFVIHPSEHCVISSPEEMVYLSLSKNSNLAKTDIASLALALSGKDYNNICIPKNLHATQQSLNTLQNIYDHDNIQTSDIISQQSLDELVTITNLNTFLVPDEKQSKTVTPLLINALIEQIKHKKPSELVALEQVNYHIAENLFEALSHDKSTLSHDKPFECYVNTFSQNYISHAQNTASLQQLPITGDLIFLTNNFFACYQQNPQTHCSYILLQYDGITKTIPLQNSLTLDDNITELFSHFNDLFFITYNAQQNTIKKYNLSTLQFEYLIENVTAYSPIDRNCLCLANTDGIITLWDYQHNTTTKIETFDLQENERIISIQYHKNNNQQYPIIALSTNQRRIGVSRNNRMSFVSKTLPFGVTLEVHINPSGTKLLLFPKKFHNIYMSNDPVLLIDLNSQNLQVQWDTRLRNIMSPYSLHDGNTYYICISWYHNYVVLDYVKYVFEDEIYVWEVLSIDTSINEPTKKHRALLSGGAKKMIYPSNDYNCLIKQKLISENQSTFTSMPFTMQRILDIFAHDHVILNNSSDTTMQQQLLALILTRYIICHSSENNSVILNKTEHDMFYRYVPESLQEIFSSKISTSEQPKYHKWLVSLTLGTFFAFLLLFRKR